MSYKEKVIFPTGFQRLNNVTPGPKLSKENGVFWWYFNVYGRYGTDPYKQLVFKWKPATTAVQVSGMPGETTDRGSIGISHIGTALEFSWQGTDLYVQEIPGFIGAIDIVVEMLQNAVSEQAIEIANLKHDIDIKFSFIDAKFIEIEQRLTEIETALGNISQASLSPEYILALKWVINNTKALG